MKAIVYTSNAGSTKEYAEMLSAKTGIAAYDFSAGKIPENSEVIYFGWVMGGDIQGISKARERFGELKAVVAVGMMVSEKTKAEVSAKNFVSEPFFYLPGEFNISKLKGMYKMMMNMMLRMMKGKVRESGDPDDKRALELFENGFNGVKEENLSELVEFIGG